MEENRAWTVSALAGFALVVLVMVFNIYLDSISITGAIVAENAGDYRTAAVILFALFAMAIIVYIHRKLQNK